MKKLIFALSILFLLNSCSSNQEEKKTVITESQIKEPMMNVNKILIEKEDQEIEDYIRRYKWDTEETGTGLHYMIYKKTNNERGEPGDIAIIDYSIGLLNGVKCYSSEESGPKQFVIAKDQVEPGLHEVVQLMCVGEQAKVIIPSYKGYGVPGDQEKIPRRATLVYDIKLRELIKNP